MSVAAVPRAATVATSSGRDAVASWRGATWPVYTTLFSAVCIVVGLIWDISWHRTVGRDTFWTYPHVLEQIAAIVAGAGCGWLVLQTTFGRSAAAAEARAASVRVWGFRGPLGAWVCIWGTVMMITSAPFDNWWHNAYGLDVKILSPPHMVLAAGMVSVQLGALLVALAAQNRSQDPAGERLDLPFVVGAGIIVCMLATAILERGGFPNQMHVARFYTLTACILPLPLVAFARASSLRWPATTIAAVYMTVVLVMLWVLPLFPATPKLAPIYNPVTHMVPPPFPYLLVAPAFVLDLVMRYGRGRADWGQSVALGVAFVAVFFVVQWYFADFLLTPHARNAFFAADRWDYNIRPGAWRHTFWAIDHDASGAFSPARLASGMARAVVYGVLSARLGLWLGAAMRRVTR